MNARLRGTDPMMDAVLMIIIPAVLLLALGGDLALLLNLLRRKEK